MSNSEVRASRRGFDYRAYGSLCIKEPRRSLDTAVAAIMISHALETVRREGYAKIFARMLLMPRS